MGKAWSSRPRGPCRDRGNGFVTVISQNAARAAGASNSTAPPPPRPTFPGPGGVSADQRYSFWATSKGKTGPLDSPRRRRLRHLPLSSRSRVDPTCSPETESRDASCSVGCGSEGTDPEAIGRWVSADASHVIFTSNKQLEPDSPDSPSRKITAIYDRSPGGPAHVVSLLPGDETPGEAAVYRGVSRRRLGCRPSRSTRPCMCVVTTPKRLKSARNRDDLCRSFERRQRVFYIDAQANLELPTPPYADLFVCDLNRFLTPAPRL